MINVLPIIPEERSSGSRIYISNFEQPQSKVQKFNNGDWSLVRNLRDDYNQTITLLPVRSTRYVAIVRNGFLCIKEVQIYQRQRKCLMVSLTLKLKVEKLEYLTQELESRTRFGSCVTSLKISNQTPISYTQLPLKSPFPSVFSGILNFFQKILMESLPFLLLL